MLNRMKFLFLAAGLALGLAACQEDSSGGNNALGEACGDGCASGLVCVELDGQRACSQP